MELIGACNLFNSLDGGLSGKAVPSSSSERLVCFNSVFILVKELRAEK